LFLCALYSASFSAVFPLPFPLFLIPLFFSLLFPLFIVILNNGVDVKTLSHTLGHYSAGFTLDTYTHVTTQMQEEAARKIGGFMAGIS